MDTTASSTVPTTISAPTRPAPSAATSRPAPTPTPVLRAAALGVALAFLVTLLVTAFCWPAVRTAPRDVPIALAGPPAAVAQVSAALEQARPGAFEVVQVADEAAARAAIADRTVSGALVLGAKGATMLTVPAAGAGLATALGQVAQALDAQLLAAQGVTPPVAVTADVAVPGGSGDALGSGFPSLVLPTVIGSLLTGAAAGFVVRGGGRRLLTLAAAAVLGGLGVASVTGVWLDVVGFGWAEVGVVALAVLAIAGPVAGAIAVAGRAGLAVMAPVLLLLGNPLAAASTGPQMLPAGWAGLGQALPPGALVQALRSVSFFDGAAAGRPVLVLGLWVVGGVALLVVGAAATRRRTARAAAGPLGGVPVAEPAGEA
jgi:hypothetical protein